MGLITKAKGAPRSADSGGSGGGAKYICNVCSNDITATVRIKCASKQCPDYDLCVPCFSRGASNLHHDPRTHAFQVIEPHSIPIYDEGWGADEELLLLEGAEQYGLGSWADIADHIGGYRRKDEVRDHYIQTYLESPKFPLPERASPRDTSLSDAIPREEFQARKKRRIEERKQDLADTTIVAAVATKPTSSIPSCHEVAGFMPGRLEFESEYFNEAEEAVQHMVFAPDEGVNPATGGFDPETDLKLTIMTIYNDRLTARIDRKKVIFNHRLLEYRKNLAVEKKRTKEQRELHTKAKPFARIMSHPDFLRVYDDLEKEQNLRQAITQLQDWRRMRISTLSTGEKYEAEKAARIARNANSLSALDRSISSLRMNKNPTAPEVAPAVVEYTTSKTLPVRLTPSNPDAQYLDIQPYVNGVNGTDLSNGVGGTLTDGINGSVSDLTQRAPLAPIPNITPAKFDEETAADWQILLPIEQDLCSKLRLQPKAYICIKDAIFREAVKMDGKLKKKNVRELSKIDTTRGGRIFEFMVDIGWLSNAAKS